MSLHFLSPFKLQWVTTASQHYVSISSDGTQAVLSDAADTFYMFDALDMTSTKIIHMSPKDNQDITHDGTSRIAIKLHRTDNTWWDLTSNQQGSSFVLGTKSSHSIQYFITDMSSMFQGQSDTSDLDVRNCISMVGGMFENIGALIWVLNQSGSMAFVPQDNTIVFKTPVDFVSPDHGAVFRFITTTDASPTTATAATPSASHTTSSNKSSPHILGMTHTVFAILVTIVCLLLLAVFIRWKRS